MNKLFIVLCLLVSNVLNAADIVEALTIKGEALKCVRTIRDARSQVEQIRQTLSLRPCERDATPQEQEAIIQTIVTTETTAMLVDGAYDFKFDQTAYRLPSESLSEREKVHYGYIFCLTQTTHLLAENPLFIQEDISSLLSRRACSRYVPIWIKDILSDLKSVNWEAYVRPYLSLANFSLTETRLQERAGDQKTRKTFNAPLTEEEMEGVKKFHSSKGVKFEPNAALKPGAYKFDLFAISAATYQCMYYACQGPYGHYAARDFGEDIVDNFDFDPMLKDLVRRSITSDMLLSPECLCEESDPYVFRFVARNFLRKKLGKKFQDLSQKFIDLREKWSQFNKEDSSGEKYDEAIKVLQTKFDQAVEDNVLKQVVEKETACGVGTGFRGSIAYPNIISYLYNLNIYVFQKESENILKIDPLKCSVLNLRGKNVFVYSVDQHGSQLVSAENTVENLVAYIKAKAHEERYCVKTDAGYISRWC